MEAVMKKILFLVFILIIAGFCYLYFFPERDAKEDVELIKSWMASASVAAKVKTAISLDKAFGPLDIKVEAEGGHVILSGETDSGALRELAENIAIRVDGVETVTNEITVK